MVVSAQHLDRLKDVDIIVKNDLKKANLVNNSFISQTILDDKNALLPDLPLIIPANPLHNHDIVLVHFNHFPCIAYIISQYG